MNSTMNDQTKNTNLETLLESLRLCLWGVFFWLLPPLIPMMEPFEEFTYDIYDWIAWPLNLIAVIFVFRAARNISKKKAK